MFSRKDILNIAFRIWKGEPLKSIAQDYNTTQKALNKLRKDNRAEFAHLETEFRAAEIQRLHAGDPVKAAHYGFVIAAYMRVRTRAHLPGAMVEFSRHSDKPEAILHTIDEAEAVLADFEADFGITLV